MKIQDKLSFTDFYLSVTLLALGEKLEKVEKQKIPAGRYLSLIHRRPSKRM
jgi:hypothetical protein